MELLQLKYFAESAVNENFSKTAKKYNVPPSDISQSIRRLEKELGVSLFVRKANSISLNEKGKIFYKKICSALQLISDAQSEITDDGTTGKINLCINTNRRIVMNTIEKHQKKYPEINIRTKFSTDVSAENFDLIISEENEKLKNYRKEKLLSENIAVAINIDKVNCDHGKFDIKSLSAYPFIAMTEPSSQFYLTQKICIDLGFKPNIAIQSDDPFYIRKCVELGLGIAITPVLSWKGQYGKDVTLLPIKGYTRETYLYTPNTKYIPVCTKRFSEMLIEECLKEFQE